MAKKYSPSGYQIIAIHEQDVDENGVIITETEDVKLLKQLFETKQISKKPLLIHFLDNNLIGYCTIYNDNYLFLIGDLDIDENNLITAIVKISIEYNNGDLVVTTIII